MLHRFLTEISLNRFHKDNVVVIVVVGEEKMMTS